MQIKRLFITITILFSLLLPSLSQAQNVSIPDANLAAAIREEIGNSITTRTLLNLKRLKVPNRGIKNLAGLEHARNLEELNLGGEYIEGKGTVNSNKVSNFSPLARLTNLQTLNLTYCSLSDVSTLATLTQLRYLHLGNNSISNISPLTNLAQLTQLYLWDNSISDISALSGLTQLTALDISFSRISDISVLSRLTQLTRLALHYNDISDISALSGLTQLTHLQLSDNDISDISALSGLTQLTSLRLSNNGITDVSPLVGLNLTGEQEGHSSAGLSIWRNPLSYASINTHIPAMQAKGVEIQFTNRVPIALMKVLGIAQQGVVNTTLPLPFVVEVLDAEGRAFAGVPVKFTVTAGGGKLSATTVRTDATGKATAHLKMGRTVGTTTVRVTAAKISKPVQFTATAILQSAPVTIPDANLRAKIAETIGKPLGGTLTTADMLTLQTLTANNADILDLTGLQHAANLTTLSLNNNSISNVSLLAGLTQLTTLDLRNNRISDVSPLAELTQLTALDLRNNWISDVSSLTESTQLKGSKDLHELYLQGNALTDISINAYIPMLQAAGVNVRFDSVLIQSRPMVRLIYFLPRDRQPQPGINIKMDRFIKDVQEYFADQMEARGFGRKTFQFETDAHGNAVVYHIKGKFDDTYHHDSMRVREEIDKQFDLSKNIYLIALDISSEIIGTGENGLTCGVGSDNGSHGGFALMPASGSCFGVPLAAHELGHAFGLQHDFRSGDYLMSYGHSGNPYRHGNPSKDIISQCAAEWLDVHRAFNPSQPTSNKLPTVEMLSQSLAAPPNAIRFRFKVIGPDGLHQAQLQTIALQGTPGHPELIDCKRLNGTSSSTLEFVTTRLHPGNKSITLTVIDVYGDFAQYTFEINVSKLLPPPKIVSIPDKNLAAALQQEIGKSITTHTMLALKHFDASNRGITDLTGLEYARNLKSLSLGTEWIEGSGYVNSNMITDISSLTDLTQLTGLYLSGNAISDISPLTGLTQLIELYLSGNAISDISPLTGLTQLTELDLFENAISDISPLTGLTQLTKLYLFENAISDISPLTGLTQLTELDLFDNDISDISPLTGLTQLLYLYLEANSISDVSPLANLKRLEVLYLRGNAISDISPLVGLNLRSGWFETTLNLTDNPLNYTSVHTHIPAMQAKGVKVKFDNRTHSALVKISGDTQEGEVGTRLATPLVVEAMNARGAAMAGLSVKFRVIEGGGRLSATTVTTDVNGRAQITLTLGPNLGANKVRVTASEITSSVIFTTTAMEAPRLTADVNGDGVVNIQDLVLVSSNFGQIGQNSADVNGDGVVNISDLVLVAGAFGAGAAAAPTLHPSDLEGLTAAEVQDLLTQARQMALTDPAYLRGIAVLEQLLVLLLPKETALLPNYPNPFNPETWIPYQLVKPAEVTLHIYTVNGVLVRTLALGHQPAGTYHSKSRAAYWDGRNEQGERVASGVYFYTLTAGDFTATRKLLIRK